MNRNMTKPTTQLASLSLTVLVLLSVIAGAFAVPVAAAGNTSVEDGKTYWKGQTLEYTNSTNDNETHELFLDHGDSTEFIKQVQADENGTLVLNTSDWESGEYFIEEENNTEVVRFHVVQQEFGVSPGEDDDASDGTYYFDFESNRASFNVSVETDGNELNASELDSAFNVAQSNVSDVDGDGEDEYVIVDVHDGYTVDATFTEKQAGSYNFTFTVTDTNQSETLEDFSVREPADASAEFSKSVFTDQEGDIAEFTVELENTDRAKVFFGSNRVNYQYNFTVVDGNEDGKVTVEFNSLNAGDGTNNTVSAAHDEDDVQPLNSETSLTNAPVDPATYELSLYTMDGRENDVASLALSERSTDGASVKVIPGEAFPNKASEVVNQMADGSEVALGDKVAFVINADGLEATLDGHTASDLNAEDGGTLAASEGLSVEVTEQNPGQNQEADSLNVSKADLYQDADNDTYYLVFNTNDYPSLEDGDEYEVHLNFSEANAYIADEDEADAQDAKATFSVADAEVEFDSYDKSEEVVRVTPTNYTLSGETTLAPGSNLTIVARSTGDTPFLLTQDVNVSADRTFEAQFDFSDLEEGHNFTIEVRGFEPFDATTSAPMYDLSVNVTDENGEPIEGATVTVNGEAYDGKALEGGNYTVGASAEGYASASQDITLDGDTSLNLTLEDNTHDLTVEVVDENGSAIADATVTVDGQSVSAGESLTLEDGAYTVEASADGYEAASQQVTLDGSAATVTLTLQSEEPVTTTPEPNTTTPSTPEPPANNTTDTTTPNPGQPGFGVVVALIALVAAALLAYRRQD